MRYLTFLPIIFLLIFTGCADHFAGRFEASMDINPETGKIQNLHVVTTKNYGNITAEGSIDPKTNLPVFKIKAEKVDATSLAAIVSKSDAEIAKSIASVAGGLAGAALP